MKSPINNIKRKTVGTIEEEIWKSSITLSNKVSYEYNSRLHGFVLEY